MAALTKAEMAEALFDQLGLNKREARELVPCATPGTDDVNHAGQSRPGQFHCQWQISLPFNDVPR